jgi:uncharacterized 2Fe-2S/4Fe-4S cluster protein (DUF4445 family)
VKKTATHVQPPELDENPFDLQKTLAAAGLQSVQLTLPAIQNLPETLRQHDFSVTSVVANGVLLDFEGGDTRGQGYGIAVDLGTTTVVAKLLDYSGTVHAVASRLNRQRAYGEDVISRIGHASNPEGLKTLQKAVIDLLNDMIAELLETVKGKREQIYEMVIAGNTVMEHLFLGIQPKYLAEMPYVVFQRLRWCGRSSGLKIIQTAGSIVSVLGACWRDRRVFSVLSRPKQRRFFDIAPTVK